MLRAMKTLCFVVLVLVALGAPLVACQKSAAPAETAVVPGANSLAGPELTAMPGEHPSPNGGALPPGHPAIDQNGMPAQPTAGDKLPPGHPSIDTAAAAGPAPTGPANAGGLGWNDFAPLVRRAPKSSMRAAEYGIEGDEHAELSVFYFGEGAAGGVEANVERWLGQFSQPDGSETAKKAKRGEQKVAGMVVNTVEVTGSFAGGMGMSAGGPATDYMLLGAIANGPNGAVFFKLTGPSASVARARGAFAQMLGSLHPDAAAAH